MTKAEITTLINSNLQSATAITATKHREVELALLNFIADNLPLHKGTFSVGNIPADDGIYTITIPEQADANYIVVGSFVSNANNWNNDNDQSYAIRGKTTTTFLLIVREYAAQTQNLDFDYIIYKK